MRDQLFAFKKVRMEIPCVFTVESRDGEKFHATITNEDDYYNLRLFIPSTGEEALTLKFGHAHELGVVLHLVSTSIMGWRRLKVDKRLVEQEIEALKPSKKNRITKMERASTKRKVKGEN